MYEKLWHLFRRGKLTKEMLHLPRSIKLASFNIFLYNLGWGIVTPFMAIYLTTILKNYTEIGIVEGVLNIFAVFWAILIGGLLDKIEKRRLIRGVLFLYLPLSFIILALNTVTQFVYFRIYHSFIATSLWLSNEAYVREHSRRGEEAESFGLFDAANGLSLIIGSVIGALLIGYFGFSIFYSVSIFAGFAFIGSFFLPDHGRPVFSCIKKFEFGSVKNEFSDFFEDKSLVKLVIISFFLRFSMIFTGMILPLFLLDRGASYIEIGLITAIFYLPIMAEPYFSTLKNHKRNVLLGLFFGIFLFIMMFFMTGVFAIFVSSFLLSIAFSLIHPSLQGEITKCMPKKEKGELSAVVYSSAALAAGIGAFVGGVLADGFGLRFVFFFGAMIFAGLFLYAKRVLKDNENAPQKF